VLEYFNVSGHLFVPLNHHPIFSIESQPTDSQYALYFWQPTMLKKHLFGFVVGGSPAAAVRSESLRSLGRKFRKISVPGPSVSV